MFPSKKLIKKLNKLISHSWKSIYNFYKKQEYNIKLRKSRISLRSKQSKSSTRSQKDIQAWLDRVAKPKTPPKPEPLPVNYIFFCMRFYSNLLILAEKI